MPITLKCVYDNGSVAFTFETVDGFVAHERRYDIEHGTVILDGYDEVILRHDAQMLLAMPNGLYRLPTPEEQNADVQVQQAALTVSEDVAPAPAKGKAKQSRDDNGG